MKKDYTYNILYKDDIVHDCYRRIRGIYKGMDGFGNVFIFDIHSNPGYNNVIIPSSSLIKIRQIKQKPYFRKGDILKLKTNTNSYDMFPVSKIELDIHWNDFMVTHIVGLREPVHGIISFEVL